MKKGIKNLKLNRVYSEEFKRLRVKEYEAGQYTVNELSLLYHVKPGVIYRWIHKYSTYQQKQVRIVEMTGSSTKKVKELQSRIKELEQIVGQKQIKIDYLEKMIEIAKDDLGIDIKKNSDTPQSTGSGKTRKS
jgi:transposase